MAYWTLKEIPPMVGKLAIVTGANSGIGKVTARELARKGAHVILACRSTDKAAAAFVRIKKAVPAAQLDIEALDLSDLKSVRTFADRILGRNVPVDLLANNAGVMMPSKRKTTADGFELQFGTNHLGHFALTGLLLPALLAAPEARVVTVSSVAHKRAKIYFDDLQAERSYRAYKRYGQSKLANLLFGFQLERRLRAKGVDPISIVVHPGIARTRLFLNGPGVVTHSIMNVIGQSEKCGALPSLFACTSATAAGGKYYGPNGPFEFTGCGPVEVKAKPQALDEEAAKKLWQISEQLTRVHYDELDLKITHSRVDELKPFRPKLEERSNAEL